MDDREAEIRRLVEVGDATGATTLSLRCYGDEVFRFLIAFAGSEPAAGDVFSLVSEGIWRGISRFDWTHSLRSWLFGIARKASLRYQRDRRRRAAHELPIGVMESVLEVEAQIRTRTASWLRTERRDRFAELRDDLDPEDRALLLLRIDQRLSWNDCARALHDEALDEADLKREAARLRKRFQLIKDRLVEIGRREGLLQSN